jgi:hypothetical protein
LVTHHKNSEVFSILVQQTLGFSTRLSILDKELKSNSPMMIHLLTQPRNSLKRQQSNLDQEPLQDIS